MQTGVKPLTFTTIHLLDLDGTLMDSADIDNRCYWRAVFHCLGQQEETPDLGKFQHVTDSGILHEWCRRTLGRKPAEDEIAAVKERFLELIRQAVAESPQCFRPLAGVASFLQQHLRDRHHCLAIATGGWRHTAAFKLKAAGLQSYPLPLVSSDDDISRIGILKIARRKALQTGGDHTFNRVICYGDGLWDAVAAKRLGAAFIGVAKGRQAARLLELGAQQVVPDFATLKL